MAEQQQKKKCISQGRKSRKASHKRYNSSNVYHRHRIARIERHIKNHPNDAVAPLDLKRIETAKYADKPTFDDSRLPGTRR